MSRLFSCFLIFHSCFFSFAPSCHPPSVHTYSDIPSCSFSPSFSFTVSFWSFFIISASPLLFHTAWLLSLFLLFSLWPSFIFTYSLFLPPLLLCKVVAVCLKSGLIELRSGESTATSILHTHRNTRTHRYQHLLFLSLFFYQRCLTHRDWSGCTHTHTAQSSIKGVYRSLPAAVVLVWFLHCFLFQLIHLCLWPQHTYKYSHTRTDTYSQIYTQIHTPLQHY